MVRRGMSLDWSRNAVETATSPSIQHQLRAAAGQGWGQFFYKSLLALTVSLRCRGLQRGGSGVFFFVRGNRGFVLQGEPNIVQAVQQAVPHELINLKLGAKSSIIVHLPLLQFNGEFIAVDLDCSPHQFGAFPMAQKHSEKPVLGAVVAENS